MQSSDENDTHDDTDATLIVKRVKELLPDHEGFECHPFQIGWYNASVGEHFQLSYDNRAVAVVVLSTPSFFDSAFKQWLQKQKSEDETFSEFVERFGSDPIQRYCLEKFNNVKEALLPTQVEVIHDFDFLPSRKPKILMTTCGHVSGAAYFYRPVEDFLWPANTTNRPKRLLGISLHPKYGGHFAYRVVLVFPQILDQSDWKMKEPNMILKSISEQREAIELFNNHWMDGRFRDCGSPAERYSDMQLKYFATPPEERWPVIAEWFDQNRSLK